MSVCKTYISCHDIPCHQEICDKSMNYMRKACAGLKQEMSVTKHIFASRLWMVMSQSVQGVACNKELQRANKSGTFVNSSNGTYFSPRSLSDRLSRRNDGLIPAWTSQVMVYVNPSHLPRAGFVRIRSGRWGYWHTHGVSCDAHRTLSNYLLPSCNPRYNRANDFSPINRSYP